MWDNAYLILALQGDAQPIPEILHLCAQKGNPDLVVEFASTSKITLPGAGMAVMAASENNIHYFTQLMEPQMISYDKVNQPVSYTHLPSFSGSGSDLGSFTEIPSDTISL